MNKQAQTLVDVSGLPEDLGQAKVALWPVAGAEKDIIWHFPMTRSLLTRIAEMDCAEDSKQTIAMELEPSAVAAAGTIYGARPESVTIMRQWRGRLEIRVDHPHFELAPVGPRFDVSLVIDADEGKCLRMLDEVLWAWSAGGTREVPNRVIIGLVYKSMRHMDSRPELFEVLKALCVKVPDAVRLYADMKDGTTVSSTDNRPYLQALLRELELGQAPVAPRTEPVRPRL